MFPELTQYFPLTVMLFPCFCILTRPVPAQAVSWGPQTSLSPGWGFTFPVPGQASLPLCSWLWLLPPDGSGLPSQALMPPTPSASSQLPGNCRLPQSFTGWPFSCCCHLQLAVHQTCLCQALRYRSPLVRMAVRASCCVREMFCCGRSWCSEPFQGSSDRSTLPLKTFLAGLCGFGIQMWRRV